MYCTLVFVDDVGNEDSLPHSLTVFVVILLSDQNPQLRRGRPRAKRTLHLPRKQSQKDRVRINIFCLF